MMILEQPRYTLMLRDQPLHPAYSHSIYSHSAMPRSWRKYDRTYQGPGLDPGIERLLVLAAETGARFEREDVDCDPLSWLYAPKRFLKGRAPVDACRERQAFGLAMQFHERGIGLDGSLDPFDGSDNGGGSDLRFGASTPCEPGRLGVRRDQIEPRTSAVRQRLFTSTIVDLDGPIEKHVFHAAVVGDISEIDEALVLRFGLRMARIARTREGFDPSDPVVMSLVSEATELTLEQLACDATGRLAEGLEIVLESRFAA